MLNAKNTDSESDYSDDKYDGEEVDVDKMMGLITQEAEQKI